MAETQLFCEIQQGGVWVLIGIAQAFDLPHDTKKRCPECHGQLRAHRAGKDGPRAHFEHRMTHSGCQFSHHFEGVRSKHPAAIE
jgi:hypothetical protein